MKSGISLVSVLRGTAIAGSLSALAQGLTVQAPAWQMALLAASGLMVLALKGLTDRTEALAKPLFLAHCGNGERLWRLWEFGA